MVTEIPAFAASDGSLYKTYAEASRRDAALKLESLKIFNHATIQAVLENHAEILEALGCMTGYSWPATKAEEQR